MPDPHSSPSDRSEAETHTIASTLRAARQEQGRTLSQAATTLQLAVPDLAELERQDDASVVADVRTMARLRVYGRYLALDPERMLTNALQAQGAPQQEIAGQSTGLAPTRETLPPPPATGESRGKRVSGAALLVILGIVAAVGTAAAAVVFNEQPEQQVRLNSPGEEQTDGTSEGDNQAQPLTSDGDLAADDEQPSLSTAGEDPEGADEATDREDADASGDPAGTSSAEDNSSHPSTESADEPHSGDEPEPADRAESAENSEDLPGRPPEQTSVQVLDGAGDTENRDDAIQLLEEHGYVVAAVNAASTPHEQSTIFYSEGWEDEAEALAAREDRLEVSDQNPGFSEDIGLHVVVGTDWDS